MRYAGLSLIIVAAALSLLAGFAMGLPEILVVMLLFAAGLVLLARGLMGGDLRRSRWFRA